ncbi:FYVE zinc finger protein [Phlyctema vagabunda]|uniref:RING-type E3 ubiquitin transferase n=1 Tax=Phlyctema vagabunda TaxID=108571 RepID=A0ABR4PPP6_9HELO
MDTGGALSQPVDHSSSSSSSPGVTLDQTPVSTNLSHIYPSMNSHADTQEEPDAQPLSTDQTPITPSLASEGNVGSSGGDGLDGVSARGEEQTGSDPSQTILSTLGIPTQETNRENALSHAAIDYHTGGRPRASSRESEIDLLTALAGSGATGIPQTRSSPSPMPPRRRTSTEIVRARWQPDAEVTYCPICHTQFGWVVRKHHCRKCGRVVCGSCSTHRITIPHEYIARPPYYNFDDDLLASHRTGGERVRLCNPCVPDPNVAPPQVASSHDNLHRRDSDRTHARSSSSVTSTVSNTSRHQNRSSFIVDNFSRRRVPSVVQHADGDDNQDGNRSRSTTLPGRDARDMDDSSVGIARRPEPRHPQGRYRSVREDNSRPLPRLPPPTEDDICPVCHKLLPPRALANFEELRATHISACIESHTTSHYATHSRPEPYTSNSQPAALPPPPQSTPPALEPPRPQRRRESSVTTSTPSGSRIIPNTPEARTAAREQAHAAIVLGASRSPPLESSRQTRLFPYKATEKDCVDDAECTICLEEFEVGADMARLECFCRFHLQCTRSWWVQHHGRCPVHQHDGYGF